MILSIVLQIFYKIWLKHGLSFYLKMPGDFLLGLGMGTGLLDLDHSVLSRVKADMEKKFLFVSYNPTIALIRVLKFSRKEQSKPLCCLINMTLSKSRAMDRRHNLLEGNLFMFSLNLNR